MKAANIIAAMAAACANSISKRFMAFSLRSVIDLLHVADVGVGTQVPCKGNSIVLVLGGHENRGAIEPFLAPKAGQGYQILGHGLYSKAIARATWRAS